MMAVGRQNQKHARKRAVENQKQVSHFPTATNPFSPDRKTGPRAGLRPPPGGGRFAPP